MVAPLVVEVVQRALHLLGDLGHGLLDAVAGALDHERLGARRTGLDHTTLVVVALGAIVLGMGLPPGATYFIIVIALSSGIEAVGIPPLTLHLFVVFFAVISTVTPPVAEG